MLDRDLKGQSFYSQKNRYQHLADQLCASGEYTTAKGYCRKHSLNEDKFKRAMGKPDKVLGTAGLRINLYLVSRVFSVLGEAE